MYSRRYHRTAPPTRTSNQSTIADSSNRFSSTIPVRLSDIHVVSLSFGANRPSISTRRLPNFRTNSYEQIDYPRAVYINRPSLPLSTKFNFLVVIYRLRTIVGKVRTDKSRFCIIRFRVCTLINGYRKRLYGGGSVVLSNDGLSSTVCFYHLWTPNEAKKTFCFLRPVAY